MCCSLCFQEKTASSFSHLFIIFPQGRRLTTGRLPRASHPRACSVRRRPFLISGPCLLIHLPGTCFLQTFYIQISSHHSDLCSYLAFSVRSTWTSLYKIVNCSHPLSPHPHHPIFHCFVFIALTIFLHKLFITFIAYCISHQLEYKLFVCLLREYIQVPGTSLF